MEILGWILEVFGIISSIVALIVSLYVLSLKSYFQKKGENLATKEDIAAITKEVESVKTDFQFKNHVKTNLHEAKKIAAINTYELLQLHFLRLSDLRIKPIKELLESDQYVIDLEKIYIDDYDKFILALSRLELYIGRDSLFESFQKASDLIAEFWNYYQQLLIFSVKIKSKPVVGISEYKILADDAGEKLDVIKDKYIIHVEQLRQQVFTIISTD